MIDWDKLEVAKQALKRIAEIAVHDGDDRDGLIEAQRIAELTLKYIEAPIVGVPSEPTVKRDPQYPLRTRPALRLVTNNG